MKTLLLTIIHPFKQLPYLIIYGINGMALVMLFMLCLSSSYVSAQEWNGASNTTGSIHREGNVGLGTTAPLFRLHILEQVGDRSTSALFLDTENDDLIPNILFGKDGDYVGNIRFNADNAFQIQSFVNNGFEERFTITQNGDVGIGTTDPAYRMHIKEDADDINTLFLDTDADNLRPNLAFGKAGSVLGNIRIDDNDDMQLQINGYTTVMTITEDSKVGIGTSDPDSKLHIVGDQTIDGNINMVGDHTIEGDINLNGEINIDSLHIADLGNFNLGLDGDVIPYANTNYDLGNNDPNECWSDVVADNFVTCSDESIKKGIADMGYGLSEILQLRAVRYKYLKDLDVQKDRLGLIAQEVEQVIPEIVKTHDVDMNAEGRLERKPVSIWGINYSLLSVVLIKAIQEQNDQLTDLQQRVEDLEKKLDVLNDTRIQTNGTPSVQNALLQGEDLFRLDQNVPNPFGNETEVHYFLSNEIQSAELHITDLSGQLLKRMNISDRGEGSASIHTADLPNGHYQYSLIINGKIAGTKRMVIAK